ncbi:MAG: oligosaccharide flippase family protein, partial [Patescibacteria group bacterium]|nr:oligosaccharide flippase family protein [Patescibacteria group bacterium]
MSKKIQHAKNELLKTGKDFTFYLPTKIIPAVLGFITIPIFTYTLGTENYGILSLVTIFISLSVSIATNWLTSPIIRFLPKYKKKNKISLFSSTLSQLIIVFSFSLAIISLTVFYLLKSKLDQPLYLAFLIASIQILFSAISQSYIAFFRADRKTKTYLSYSLTKTLLSSGLSIGFVLLGYGIIGILLGEIIASITVVCVYLGKIKLFFETKLFSFSKKIAKEAISFGLPLVISALSVWLLSSSDRYMIKYFLDNSAVGIYTIPYNITQQSLFLIISSFVLASTPSLVNSWENSKENTADFLKYLNRIFIILILPLTILISILGKPIILLLAPADFLNGYKIMALVAFGV